MPKQHRVPPMAALPQIPKMIVPPNIEWDPNNPMQVNSCSGADKEHAPGCDGSCEKITVDEFDVAIENERREWARHGMEIGNYSTNQLRLDVQVQTIITIMQERLEISDDEFNKVFKPKMLEQMRNVRETFQGQVASARTRSSIVIPGKSPLQ